jgi:putative nucleotidyltransferase with HDIG domain
MLKRIAAKDIRIGMFITELCGSWMEHPFFKTKFLLEDPQDLESLLKSGIKEVWINTDKGLDADEIVQGKTLSDVELETETMLHDVVRTNRTEKTTMLAEVKNAQQICARAKEAMIVLFNDARMGNIIEVENAQELVEDISDSVFRQPHALISLARLKKSNEYTYMHSVAVCALMIALARQLNLDEDMVREAGMAGLLHDLGKIGIPDKILNKPGKLTDEEFNVMKSHPQIGASILTNNPSISALVIDVVLHHHEKIDSSGYPHHLTGDNISLFAKMGAVCDVYDAITSNRPYKKGWSPAESVRKMAEWSKGHFDEGVFQAFVKTVGIYPTGSLVRLESGRLGVVTEQSETSLLTPKVKIFFSAKMRTPIRQETLDLSNLIGKEKIIGRESPEEWGFRNLEELWSGL